MGMAYQFEKTTVDELREARAELARLRAEVERLREACKEALPNMVELVRFRERHDPTWNQGFYETIGKMQTAIAEAEPKKNPSE